MSEDVTPRLPDSDDPYEILGVGRGSSELDVKRAYTRLIRVFRPDHAPEDFRRVRGAYEAVLSDLEYERLLQGEYDHDDGKSSAHDELRPFHRDHLEGESPHDTGVLSPQPAARWAGREVWSVFETDGPEEAQKILEQMLEEAPSDLDVHAAHFLLAEIRGDERAFPDLASALSNVPELSAWADTVLSADEQVRLAGQDASTLQGLQRQRDTGSAVRLMRRRVDALLRRGQMEEALTEASDPVVLQAARDDSEVSSALLRVACAAAWSHPEQSAHLFERAMEGAAPGVRWEAAYDARVRMRPLFEAWRDRHSEAHDLIRLLTICDGLDAEALESERRRLASAARARPVLYLEAITSLTESDPELYVLFFEALGWGEDEEPPGETGEGEQPTIEAALRATDKAIDKDFGNKITIVTFLGVIGVSIWLFVSHGWWGLAGVALLVPWFLYVVEPADARIYRNIFRPQLAKTVARTGCTVEDLLRALDSVETPADNIGRFKTEVLEDDGLRRLVYLLRSTAM